MRRVLRLAVAAFVLSVMASWAWSADFLADGNALYEKGKTSYEAYKESGDAFAKALEADPKSYEAAWKAARSYREYANEAKKKNVANWKSICKEYGKLGMKYGEKAIALNPNGVEGNFWFGCSVGNYSDAVSVLTALKEGLKDKTQKSFEKSYQLNKMYVDGGPMKALGRFWFVLPWPLQDKKLSLQHLREFQKSFPNDPEGQVFLAEVLLKTGDKDEAKVLLQKASQSSDKYFADWAKRLLSEM
ncbi:MAG TPA: tetratricopeptide repeat protein [Deltaproteobacteria bacterium]|nr:tetratricopeptide repeat protein [Deltaproteobacteria bacterium]HOM29937.1 tetratricopeptide repeat protein [Deltaproteobacteria bacterium]HPP81752.1 tetratricopeptide repeat protein [Deltaproteobacteria bacterium]